MVSQKAKNMIIHAEQMMGLENEDGNKQYWRGFIIGVERMFFEGKISDSDDELFRKKASSTIAGDRLFGDGYLKAIAISEKMINKKAAAGKEIIQAFRVSVDIKKYLDDVSRARGQSFTDTVRGILLAHYRDNTEGVDTEAAPPLPSAPIVPPPSADIIYEDGGDEPDAEPEDEYEIPAAE